MTDKELLIKIFENDPSTINDFFFMRCRDTFTYIGQYFCDGMSAEEIIGEAYEVLSSDDWHKLKIFKFSSSLVTYVSVIIARHFQHKRDRLKPMEDDAIIGMGGNEDNEVSEVFLMDDIKKNLVKFNSLDRLLITRILLEGEKPRDIIDEVKPLIREIEGEAFVKCHSKEQLSGYVYTRYSRAKSKFKERMKTYGY